MNFINTFDKVPDFYDKTQDGSEPAAKNVSDCIFVSMGSTSTQAWYYQVEDGIHIAVVIVPPSKEFIENSSPENQTKLKKIQTEIISDKKA